MTSHIRRLLASAAAGTLGLAAFAGTAHAQAVATQDELLGEVVVTATRQADTVSRVPLSISAVTQKAMDQQGIKNLTDLARSVPALNFRRTGSDGTTNIAIRGIYATAGAATTGVYLDDTPLQKRFSAGAVPGNGNPYPELFDLERVEVLRGPQGTLYGGSSEGGTVRFITPSPSLTRYSAYARAEVNSVRFGKVGGDVGVAVGGPIVQDKLGFRASVSMREVGGWIDHVNYLTGQTTMKDTNGEHVRSLRAAVTWAPTERLRITPAIYSSKDNIDDLDNQWENVPSFTVATRTYNAAGAVTTNPAQAVYTLPGYTYPALNFYGRGKIGQPNASPRTNSLDVGTLTMDYEFPGMTAKSITSYIHDQGKGMFDQTAGEPTSTYGVFGGYIYNIPNFAGTFRYYNKRHGLTEELRFSSDPKARFNWVTGVYFAHFDGHGISGISEQLDQLVRAVRGISAETFYKSPGLPNNLVSYRDQVIDETELAGFGEANYFVTDKLKLTAGVRISRNENSYYVQYYGQLAGYNTPTLENGGITSGSVTESPVTPKFGLSYQLTDADLLYVTAAKGYRPGGVNATVPAVYCSAGLAALGGATPTTYGSDSVWSYEGGAKLRLFGNRMQLNSSAFYIDWKDIQVNAAVSGCPYSYVTNVGKAVSKGFDMQGSARIGGGLSVNFAVGYTDAKYTEAALGPPRPGGLAPAVLVNKGDELPVSPWTASVGFQYDRTLGGRFNGYLRGDYQYASSYHRTVGPGATGYTPDSYIAESTHIANLRLGVAWDRYDVSLFVNNLFDSHDKILRSTGRSSCSNLDCSAYATLNYLDVFNTFRPRSFGLTATYRY